MDSQVNTTHTIESEMVTSSSTETLVEPLDLYMVYLYPNPDGQYLGNSEIPFMFEFYAEDARHALEQFSNDGTLLDEEVLITRIEVKQVDPFYNEDLEQLDRLFDK